MLFFFKSYRAIEKTTIIQKATARLPAVLLRGVSRGSF